MTHAGNILAQLREAERDEAIPEEKREVLADRADELETEIEEGDREYVGRWAQVSDECTKLLEMMKIILKCNYPINLLHESNISLYERNTQMDISDHQDCSGCNSSDHISIADHINSIYHKYPE